MIAQARGVITGLVAGIVIASGGAATAMSVSHAPTTISARPPLACSTFHDPVKHALCVHNKAEGAVWEWTDLGPGMHYCWQLVGDTTLMRCRSVRDESFTS